MENPNNTNTITKSIISFVVFIGVVVGAIALAMSSKKDTTVPAPTDENLNSTTTDAAPVSTATTTVDSTATSSATSTTSAAHTYKDGTYAATGTYKSPAGIEQVNISVTLKDDVVTETSFKGLAENSRSINFQEQFANGYKALVVGKNIDDVKLSKISGSSLTSVGFNDAIGKIKDEAHS
ncbi:MAG: hypothetical protein V4576_02045 [Patescibacteria group bacterium]